MRKRCESSRVVFRAFVSLETIAYLPDKIRVLARQTFRSWHYIGFEIVDATVQYTTSIILVARAAAGIDDRADNQ